jgi:dipeptidyl aminopeptidase/acylaminoacyl peptidase
MPGPVRFVPILAAASLAVALLALAAPLFAADSPLIPRDVLFGNPSRVNPSISLDGTRLSYLAPHEGVMNLWVRTIGQENDRPITFDQGRGILGYFWAPNGDQLLYIQDKNGDENYHIYSVPAAGGDARDLTPVDGVRAEIVSVVKEIPDEILIGLNDRNPQLHDLYRLNVRTGDRKLEVQNDLGAVSWGIDRTLTVRLAVVPTSDGGFSVQKRNGAEWGEFLKIPSSDALGTELGGFMSDNRTFYVTTPIGVNAAELRAYDIETGEYKVVASDPHYDVSYFIRHPDTYAVQAVSFEKDRLEWKILDPALEPHFAELRKLSPGDFFLVGRDRQARVWIVAFNDDRGPVRYYAYDTRSKKAEFLFVHQPELEGLGLAEMKPAQFSARDGLTIHGYLTLPPGSNEKDLPTVLNVHGGPWYRDSWGYNPEAQWLANRGYACLQVNFRGSTGYGKEFVNAGDREWGGKMQDDLSDAVAWLIREGVSDPKRIAIYGGSYGGYATLCGMSMTPELYACGISMVGPSNLITFIQTIPPYWAPMKAVFAQRVGDLEKDTEFLKARSPLTHVDRIRAPLFIAQGANDPRVNRAESLQIVDAMKQAGKPVEYLEFPDEGHGFARPENRIRFYAAAEKFLARHLGGRSEE